MKRTWLVWLIFALSLVAAGLAFVWQGIGKTWGEPEILILTVYLLGLLVIAIFGPRVLFLARAWYFEGMSRTSQKRESDVEP